MEVLEVGGTWGMAAAAAHISVDALKRWRDDIADFAEECARARDSGAAKLVSKVRKAAEGGDWRAASWLLERTSPNEYGRRVQVAGPGGGPVPIEGELRVADGVRANQSASDALHDAIAKAAGTGS